jgi:hypothetical protein
MADPAMRAAALPGDLMDRSRVSPILASSEGAPDCAYLKQLWPAAAVISLTESLYREDLLRLWLAVANANSFNPHHHDAA